MDSKSFLKMFRIELDRLIEQAPSIPNSVINEFKILFEESDVHLPDILGVMEHTKVFTDSNSRLKKIAVEATLAIQQKKGILKQLVLDDLDDKIQKMFKKELNKIEGNHNTSEGSESTITSPKLHNIIIKV
jgi:hypothetical protein